MRESKWETKGERKITNVRKKERMKERVKVYLFVNVLQLTFYGKKKLLGAKNKRELKQLLVSEIREPGLGLITTNEDYYKKGFLSVYFAKI